MPRYKLFAENFKGPGLITIRAGEKSFYFVVDENGEFDAKPGGAPLHAFAKMISPPVGTSFIRH